MIGWLQIKLSITPSRIWRTWSRATALLARQRKICMITVAMWIINDTANMSRNLLLTCYNVSGFLPSQKEEWAFVALKMVSNSFELWPREIAIRCLRLNTVFSDVRSILVSGHVKFCMSSEGFARGEVEIAGVAFEPISCDLLRVLKSCVTVTSRFSTKSHRTKLARNILLGIRRRRRRRERSFWAL